jgi:hypothetical protein
MAGTFAQTLVDVVAYQLREGYQIHVEFSDGFRRTIDFEPILYGPLWGTLRNPSEFRRVRLDRDVGTLVWPGDLDIDPNVLRDWPEHLDAMIARRQQYAVLAQEG